MFVVRIQNDEATMYRAFRSFQTAALFADDHVGHEDGSVVHVFTAVADQPAIAVREVQLGEARLLKLATPRVERDMPFLAGVLASIGLGARATA